MQKTYCILLILFLIINFNACKEQNNDHSTIVSENLIEAPTYNKIEATTPHLNNDASLNATDPIENTLFPETMDPEQQDSIDPPKNITPPEQDIPEATEMLPTYPSINPTEPQPSTPDSFTNQGSSDNSSHTHTYTETVVAPTCTDKGFTLHTCTVCGHQTSDEETEEMGHSWSDWKEIKPATTTATGEKERVCYTCGETESAVIPKLDPPHTHTYTETVVASTCTKSGYTLYSCECGNTYISNETSKAGHLYGSWETTKKPTTAETGERQCVCSRCGHVNVESIDKLPTEKDDTYTSYIDPRIEITKNGSGATRYFYFSVSVIDSRSWGSPPTIQILDNGGFYIVYYQQDGTKISYSLNPVEGYINRLVILENGSYTTRLIGDYND